MRRFEAIQELLAEVSTELVVSNIGHPSQELFRISDRPRNFYMLGSMGLCSSIALGLALAQKRPVLALEGDGSILMNLGSLATIGATAPGNLVLALIDNESYGSTGFQPSFTATSTKLEQVAAACGIAKCSLLTGRQELRPALRSALRDQAGPYCFVIKTRPGKPELAPVPHDSLFIRDRFMESLRDAD